MQKTSMMCSLPTKLDPPERPIDIQALGGTNCKMFLMVFTGIGTQIQKIISILLKFSIFPSRDGARELRKMAVHKGAKGLAHPPD